MSNRAVTRLTSEVQAARIGCSVEEYLRETAAGREWCRRCSTWVANQRMSSSVAVCCACAAAYQRKNRRRAA